MDDRKQLILTIELGLYDGEGIGPTYRARVTGPDESWTDTEFYEGQLGPCTTPGEALARLGEIVNREAADAGWRAVAEGCDMRASDDPSADDDGRDG